MANHSVSIPIAFPHSSPVRIARQQPRLHPARAASHALITTPAPLEGIVARFIRAAARIPLPVFFPVGIALGILLSIMTANAIR